MRVKKEKKRKDKRKYAIHFNQQDVLAKKKMTI